MKIITLYKPKMLKLNSGKELQLKLDESLTGPNKTIIKSYSRMGQHSNIPQINCI